MLVYVEMYSNEYQGFKEKLLPEVLKDFLTVLTLQAVLSDVADIRLYL